MNHLQIRDLSKTYENGVQALKAVSLDVKNGMFGLLGPNGAGKSSLMRSIASLQTPSAGSIHFNDINVIEKPQELRRQLGYLPQSFGIYPKVSAWELLNHIAVLKGIYNAKERKQQVDALLAQTNLYAHRKKYVHTFSGGMRQRFGIAQALLAQPQLIIVDEPTAGLDPEERNRFLNLLSEIGEQVIVILSTHIVEDVKVLCQQMAILAQGRIVLEGKPTECIQELEGKIWRKTIDKEALEAYKTNYQILSTRLLAGKTQIHVLADQQPDASFEALAPDLESLYFHYSKSSI